MLIRKILPALILVVGALAISATPSAANGRCRDCAPPITVFLKVCHPCTGCEYDVKVCIPACCTDAPCVSHQHTLIGDGKTVFEWNCGHRVIVRFPCSGGYRVIQRG